MSEAIAFWPLANHDERTDGRAASQEQTASGVSTDDVACLGRIVCVSGSQIVAALDTRADKGAAARHGLRKGSLVRIFGPQATNYGIVTGLSIPMPGGEEEVALAEIDLVGEVTIDDEGIEQPFARGVCTQPTLGDFVFACTAKDLEKVYGRAGRRAIAIGTLHDDAGQK
ncbi:MAG: hypothetical protein D6782_00990, partial [Alphaproteobacteria bacterium]